MKSIVGAIRSVRSIGLFCLVSLALLVLTPSPSLACRDCPFPMRLSEGRWLMPSGEALITVDERSVGRGRVESTVRLVDTKTGAVLAEGTTQHNRGKMRVNATLVDASGGTVVAELYYQDSERKKIRIRMTCKSCSVKARYMK